MVAVHKKLWSEEALIRNVTFHARVERPKSDTQHNVRAILNLSKCRKHPAFAVAEPVQATHASPCGRLSVFFSRGQPMQI